MNETLQWIIGQLIVAAAIWGAIRADIKNIHERMRRLEERIDNHLDQQWRNDN